MFERAARTANLESVMDNPKGEPITGETLQDQIISALRTVYDPEIPVNIFDLGLIYLIKITGETLQDQIISALRTVYDPEIPVNIFDLGLIYLIKITNGKDIHIEMTLTAPACPVAGSMPGAVERAVKRVPGIESVDVQLVWEPPWGPERMSDEARLELGMF